MPAKVSKSFFYNSFFEARTGIEIYFNPKVKMNSLKGTRGVAEPDSNLYRLCVNSLGGSKAKTEGRNAIYRCWRAII